MGDADITLRHLTRRHAEAIARSYVPPGRLEVVGWGDTQVTAAERRLDRTLLVRLDGELRALEIEFEYRYEGDLPERVHDYRSLSRMALRAEHPCASSPWPVIHGPSRAGVGHRRYGGGRPRVREAAAENFP